MLLTVFSLNRSRISTTVSELLGEGTIIDQVWSASDEGATLLATSATSTPVLKAIVTASTAFGMRSSVLRLELTAAAANAPVQRPRTQASAPGRGHVAVSWLYSID